MEGLKFSLNFCRVYHTSGSLGHVYGDAHQLEAIVGTFEIGNSSYIESIQVLDRYVRLPRSNLKDIFCLRYIHHTFTRISWRIPFVKHHLRYLGRYYRCNRALVREGHITPTFCKFSK